MTSLLVLLLLAATTFAQVVPKAVLVEHFTNTRCSVCASRNPGFYANLVLQPANTLHIAYHPSSPYSNCLFSTQNQEENDARTVFYDIYGGTPRLVINGTVISNSQNYGAASMFTPFQGQTSPISVTVDLSANSSDSITATVHITSEVANSLSSLTLYLPLQQDTIVYDAPNGEPKHFDVFRQSFTGGNPIAISLNTAAGGTVTVVKTIAKNPNWTPTRLYAIAIVQDADKQLVQAAASPNFNNQVISATETLPTDQVAIYPNPVSNTLQISGISAANIRSVLIFNSFGSVVATGTSASISVEGLPSGVYWLQIRANAGIYQAVKFVKM